MYYDELSLRLFEGEVIEIDGHHFKVEELDEKVSPCSGCPLLCQNNAEFCNVCVAYDFYAFVDKGKRSRSRLKEVEK